MALPIAFPKFSRRLESVENRADSPIIEKRFVNMLTAGSSRNALGFSAGAALDAFSASEVIYRCVDLISSNLASLDLAVEKDDKLNHDHPVAQLFNKASTDALNAVATKRVMWQRMELDGECFLYLDRGQTGEGDLKDVVLIDDPCTPKFDDKNRKSKRNQLQPPLLGFEVETDRGTLPLLPTEVLWLRYPHPKDKWGAMAPGMAALFPAALDRTARLWQENELKNQARPSGTQHLGDVTLEEAQALKAMGEAQSAGPANAGRIVYTFGPTGQPGFSRISLTPAEMSYLESHRINGEDICHAFGVPVDLIFARTTYENQAAAKSFLWTETILPKKELAEAEIDRQLFPDDKEQAKFDVSAVDALQESVDAKTARAVQAFEADLVTLEEARGDIGLDPLGDERDAMTWTQYLQSIKPAQVLNPPPSAKDEPVVEEIPGETPPNRSVISQEDAIEVRAQRRAMTAKRVQAGYDRHERSMTRALVRLAEKQERVVLRNVSKMQRKSSDPIELRAAYDDAYDQSHWQEQTSQALEAPMEGLYFDAALATAESLQVDLPDTFTAQVIEQMRQRLAVLSQQITATTYQVIKNEILKEGVEGGESIPELADRLQKQFEGMKTWKAEQIARTEVVGGSNAASFATAENAGFITHKEWMTAEDERVRQSHKDQDGVALPMGERFENGLMFPGDPSTLNASEVVQCRCVLTFSWEEPTVNDLIAEHTTRPVNPVGTL